MLAKTVTYNSQNYASTLGSGLLLTSMQTTYFSPSYQHTPPMAMIKLLQLPTYIRKCLSLFVLSYCNQEMDSLSSKVVYLTSFTDIKDAIAIIYLYN